jgi:hypothetical protein
MGLKESLKKLQEAELRDKNLSLKREVKKELTKLKNEKILEKKCIICSHNANYSIKGSSDWYCKDCAIEYFGDLKHLKKTNIVAENDSKKTTKDLIAQFKKHVIEKADNPKFLHHEWYVKHHLEIVEKISLELCKKYRKANKDLVLLLVWLHDYGKIVTQSDQYSYDAGRIKLVEIGFQKDFIDKAILYVQIIDKKSEIDLNNSPIEIKIVSSADGASHMIGPFYGIYIYENYDKNFDELMKNNLAKLEKDWNRKIVLPEVKKMFAERYKFLSEQFGKIPPKFLI